MTDPLQVILNLLLSVGLLITNVALFFHLRHHR